MRLKIPKKYSSIVESLQKKDMSSFKVKSGDMGQLRRIQKDTGNKFLIFYDRRRKRGIIINNGMKIKKIKKFKRSSFFHI